MTLLVRSLQGSHADMMHRLPSPTKKNLTEEVQSIHSFPVQVPSGYPDPKQEPRPHVSNTMLSP